MVILTLEIEEKQTTDYLEQKLFILVKQLKFIRNGLGENLSFVSPKLHSKINFKMINKTERI